MPLLALSRRIRLQGIKRSVSPCSHPKAGEGFQAADPLMGFVLSRVFTSPATTHAFTRPPLMCFVFRLPEGIQHLALQGFNRRRFGLPLSRAADPPEVLVLVSSLAALGSRFAWLMVLPWTPADVSVSVSPLWLRVGPPGGLPPMSVGPE